jgi:hypothetical protein
MTIVINQAIYGDKSGAYSLLKSSFEKVDIAKRICNATDLLDRPANNVLESPIIRGFCLNDYYVLVKSFPDLSENVRTGRVFSHALIIHQDDLYELSDIEQLFSFFLDEVNKEALLNPIELIDVCSKQLIDESLKQRIYAAVNGLIDHQNFGNTVLWKGAEDYIQFISYIWKNIPPSLRGKLILGGIFNPKNIDKSKINLLYSADTSDHKWNKVEFKVIDVDSAEDLNSLGAYYICGNYEKAQRLVSVIDDFKIQVVSFEDFGYLEIIADNYCALSSESKLSHLLILSDLLSKYSPNPNVATNEKVKVLDAVLNKISKASGKEIVALQNVDWTGFKGAETKIKIEIKSWLTLSLQNTKIEQCAAEVISLAVNDNQTSNWWANATREFIHDLFDNWRIDYALAVIEWVQFDSKCLRNISQYIPLNSNIENDLVSTLNNKKKFTASSFEEFSAERNWFKLYSTCVLQLYSLEDAIRKLLAIDRDEDSLSAIRIISKKANSIDFLRVAVEIEEVRLIVLAAEHVTKDRKLLLNLDVSNEAWRKIWVASNFSCTNMWDGINEPLVVLFELLDLHIAKQNIEEQLLLDVSKSSCNDLSLFVQRKNVWQYLKPTTKDNFLLATAIACTYLLSQNEIQLIELEPEILNCLARTEVIINVIRDKDVSLQVKLSLINKLQGIEEKDLFGLLEFRFSSSEALMLADILIQRKWRLLAKKVADKVTNDCRHDLEPTKKQTKSLVPSWADPFINIFNGSGVAVKKLEEIEFKVALSFPGEKREYVEKVANLLIGSLGEHSIFYDNNFKSSISRPNADTLLQNVYRKQSELIVVFLCEEYSQKEWCGLEFRAVRDIIKAKEDDKIMFIKFDAAEINGVFSIDGYIDGNSHSPEEVSTFILERLTHLQ